MTPERPAFDPQETLLALQSYGDCNTVSNEGVGPDVALGETMPRDGRRDGYAR